MRGRPATPTALRKLAGNPGRRPLNAREPVATALASAEPPAWLDTRAKRAWRAVVPKLCASRVLTELDLQALTMLFDAYGEWWAARQIVREQGMTYQVTEMRTGADGKKRPEIVSIRKRPEVAIAADAFRRVVTMMPQFGLTPAGRARLVTAEPDGDPEDPFEAMFGGSA